VNPDDRRAVYKPAPLKLYDDNGRAYYLPQPAAGLEPGDNLTVADDQEADDKPTHAGTLEAAAAQ